MTEAKETNMAKMKTFTDSATTSRRALATARFHERAAKALETHGRKEDAAKALVAAETCRKRATGRSGWYATAANPSGGFDILWFEIRPDRGTWHTGETAPTMEAAEKIITERNSGEIEPPTGILSAVESCPETAAIRNALSAR